MNNTTITYVIQGFYGELNTNRRIWRDWYSETTEARARSAKKNLDKSINPYTKERTVPTASRLIERVTLDKVIM